MNGNTEQIVRDKTPHEHLAAKVPADLIARLDAARQEIGAAEDRFVSRSELVRRALRQFLCARGGVEQPALQRNRDNVD